LAGNSADSQTVAWPDVGRPVARSGGLPAWLLSLALHAVLFVALATLARMSYRGASLEPARGGGIVLARNEDGATQYYGEADDTTDTQRDVRDPQQGQEGALPGDDEVPLDLSGALPAKADGETGGELAGGVPSASGFTQGARPSGGRISGDQARTSVFGAEGIGNKFVYVFDRSASTDGYQGRPLAAAKAQLLASLEDLEGIHQFQIIFYNERPLIFNPAHPQPPRMLFGDAQTKRLAKNFVRAIVAAGGTKHVEALELALGMRPDVVFFLTDAGDPPLSSSQLADIRRQNARVGATIHAIEFGVGPFQGSVNFLVLLAEQNGGQHVYVDVTRLPLEQ